MTRWIYRSACAFTLLALQSCAWVPPLLGGTAGYAEPQRNPLISSSQKAVTALSQGIPLQAINDAPVLVGTVVNVNQLSRSTPLGRTLSELYASQLASHGFNVKELKLRGDIFVQEGTGELMLSREVRDIANSHQAALALVGTYSKAKLNTYISLKLVRMSDSRIVGSYDYALPNEADVQRLLAGS